MDKADNSRFAPAKAKRIRQISLAAIAVFITAIAAFWLVQQSPFATITPASVAPYQEPLTPAETEPSLASARQALENKDYVSALHLTAAAENQGTPVPAVEAMRAAIFRETDYLDREIESCQRWAAAAPKDAEPYLKLFYIYSDMAWKNEADWASKEAMKRAPGNARTHVARALFLEQNAHMNDALAELALAQRLNNGNPATVSNIRATFLLRAGQYKEAEAEIRNAVAREPSRTNHRLVLAQALFNQKRHDEAAVLFQEIQKQEPENVEAAFQLGVIATEKGDLPEATRQMEQAAKIDAQYGTVVWNLMQLYRRQGRVAESKSLARLYGKMNKSTNAFDSKVSQVHARPGDLKAHWHLATNYLSSGEYPKAIVELRAIQHFAPKDDMVLRALQIALTRAGRVTEAKAVKESMRVAAESKK